MKVADANIVSGSLLTVESNHFCVLKSRGRGAQRLRYRAICPGNAQCAPPGSIAQGFFGGNSPWQYEVIYINRSKLLVRNEGVAMSAEMAEMAYVVDYYIHIDSKEEALDLITHMPFAGTEIDTNEVAAYAGPAIEQAINQVIQVTRMEGINEHIAEVSRTGQTASRRFPARLWHHAERPQGPHHAQGRPHARADLATGDRPLTHRSRTLLSRPQDGGARPDIGPQCGGRPPLQHWRTRGRGAAAWRRGGHHAAMSSFYDVGRLGQIGLTLVMGAGYAFYREETQLRADDQKVRTLVSELLAGAHKAIVAAEGTFRRERIPPPTREPAHSPIRASSPMRADWRRWGRPSPRWRDRSATRRCRKTTG